MALNINGTTGISGVDGSVSAPAVTGTDSNTGITFPAADTIKFSTGGVERMAITNSGVSGITTGITMADSWRITEDFTNNATPIANNWERGDVSPYEGYLGSAGMTESSGIFTFPLTGWYFMSYSHDFRTSSDADWVYMQVLLSNDSGSNWTNLSYAVEHTYGGGDTLYSLSKQTMIFDITNVSTQRMRFDVERQTGTIITQGNSNRKQTGFDIFRLGDT